MIDDLVYACKAPFPWFGGKSKAAPLVWELLGDPGHYVEPFFGSGAVLLNRPHECNRPYYSETVTDADGLLCNFWRAVQWHPEETARHASWPVSAADKQSRGIALLRWREANMVDLLAGSPEWCDPKMAGWWAYVIACTIGAFAGDGAWTVDRATGRIVKQPPNGREAAVKRNLPHLGNDGRGVNAQTLREPGVVRDLPHLSDDGRGVNAQTLREPGVVRDLPHLSDNGQGVNNAGLRELGVVRDLPHLSDNGRGVNNAGLREPGVVRNLPHLGNNGRGVNNAGLREPGVSALDAIAHGELDLGAEFHDLAMPSLIRWFRLLCARLRHVRILHGDWKQIVTDGASHTLSVRKPGGVCGYFLDPPYADTANRETGLYAADSLTVAHEVADWCLQNGDSQKRRIVLAGFEGEHGTKLTDAGWTEHEWFTAGHLTGGMANTGGTGNHQQHRERLWASPNCLKPGEETPVIAQRGLFDDEEVNP